MKKIVACEPATRIIVALVVALLPLAGAGCFRSPDPNKMTCDKASACPSGYYCAIDKKRCIAGAAPSAGIAGSAPAAPTPFSSPVRLRRSFSPPRAPPSAPPAPTWPRPMGGTAAMWTTRKKSSGRSKPPPASVRPKSSRPETSCKRGGMPGPPAQLDLPSGRLVLIMNYASLRIRIVRRRLQGLRRKIHVAPPAFGQAADALSGVQKAGAQNHFHLQFTAQAQAAVHLGRQEGRVHRAQASRQGRIRAAVNRPKVESRKRKAPWGPRPFTGRRTEPGMWRFCCLNCHLIQKDTLILNSFLTPGVQ